MNMFISFNILYFFFDQFLFGTAPFFHWICYTIIKGSTLKTELLSGNNPLSLLKGGKERSFNAGNSLVSRPYGKG